MPNLEHTKVYRGGVTASHLSLETRDCSFTINHRDKALDIRFHIASKGGGTTEILLQIGIDDLPRILEHMATSMPETVGVLSDCAALANRRNLEILEEIRALQRRNADQIETLIDELGSVEDYMSEKYYAAPAGENAEELEAKNKIERALSMLRGYLMMD